MIGWRQGRRGDRSRRPWIFLPGLGIGAVACVGASALAFSPLAVYSPQMAYEGLAPILTVYFIPIYWLLTWLASRLARRRAPSSGA